MSNINDFYEKYRENTNLLIVLPESDQSYPVHFHNNIEVLIVINEKYEITVDAHTGIYDGCYVVFSDSYVLHGYRLLNKTEGICRSVLIPFAHQQLFRSQCGKSRPISCVIEDESLACKLLDLIDSQYKPNMPEYTSSALSNMLLAVMSEYLTFKSDEINPDTLLIIKILQFIDNNFRSKITLNSIAHSLGYRPEHISRVFHHYLHINLTEYINRQRYNELQYLRVKNPDSHITDLILESGFSSLQSYYRYKKSCCF